MPFVRTLLPLLLIAGLGGAPVSLAGEAPSGFFSRSAPAQLEAEQVALDAVTPTKIRAYLAKLTEEPHVAGTPQEKAVAEWVAERLASFGLETETVRYEVFLNHPREVSLKLVEPVEEELALVEDALALDKDSGPEGMFPAFHGYGASGSARGQVVYANYGTPADFKQLETMGIDVADRIVLVRYGRVFRGLKVNEAEKRGAAGVVIYSDPEDDGYAQGDVYPDGPMRHPSAIQRGSVQFLSIQPGDPSTPGWASIDGARRIARSEMKTVPQIPSLPISYREAAKVLRRLGGERVPDEWQGGLPFSYHVGPGAAVLELSVAMDEGQKPIYNVFGRIRGREEPERSVILGNHRDAWTHGAVDPNSGTAAWLETARALGKAVESGWQPRRTIVMASWDAEEYGLVGSVEWGEAMAAELSAGAVAYLNLDTAVTGSRFGVGGTPSLRDVVRETAARVPEPLESGSVGELWERRAEEEWAREAPVELGAPERPFELHLGALGSGSDYTVFVDHLGVPSINFGFRGKYGVYHSVYDNFRWMDLYGDPRFVYHQAAARFYALAAMRLAAAEVVPLAYDSYAGALGEHLDELRRRVVREARAPRAPEAAGPAPLAPDFGPLLAALDRLERAGGAATAAVAAAVERQDEAAAGRINAELLAVERGFLSRDGLPERPWFRNLVWAPGLTTGYAAWPFPELAQAIEDRDADLFARGRERVVAALGEVTARLERVAAAAR